MMQKQPRTWRPDFEILTFTYSAEHRKSLEEAARKLPGSPNFEQMFATAIDDRVMRRFKVTLKR
jgi:hypothetical protein